ncbi:MAG: class I SAM-dependent methyltransferase [Candidatus Hydrogenedentes bacterium]|nr:class I SAM-dependent methyltransferase [Candidatus Hydrogenedentota bacterium]
MLEIGPGNGTRLAAVRDLGMNALGLEIQENIAAHCQRLGLNARLENFLDHHSDAPYDVVALGEVIEHLPDLHISLEKIGGLLAPDGFVWISTPQYDNFLLQEVRSRGAGPYYEELEHWHHFTRTSLVQLMELYGFRLVQQRMGKTFVASPEYTFQRS